jgi:alkyl hydroperoxide reductase subunit AhpC
MEVADSRRIAQVARDSERLEKVEKVVISYMIDPHVEQKYWTNYIPEQLRDIVPYLANKNGW